MCVSCFYRFSLFWSDIRTFAFCTKKLHIAHTAITASAVCGKMGKKRNMVRNTFCNMRHRPAIFQTKRWEGVMRITESNLYTQYIYMTILSFTVPFLKSICPERNKGLKGEIKINFHHIFVICWSTLFCDSNCPKKKHLS